MRFLTSYYFALVVSLLLHGLVIVLMAWRWESEPRVREINRPRFIEAKVLQLKATTPKQSAPKENKVIDLTAQRREQERLEKLAAQKRAEEQARVAREKKEAEEQQRRDRERLEQAARDAERELMEQALLQDLQQEEEFLQGAEDEVMAQSYADSIRNRVVQRWSRPPSARNGMECELYIELARNGQLLSVNVVKSSGNSAFDRSAKQAVEKVEEFPEIRDMPLRLFRREFNHFKLLFRPEDLRQ